MSKTGFTLLALLLFAGSARADTPAYKDDRSDAAALVSSLYNAINRKEYARAWGYFSTPPAKDYETFVKGFLDTESVELQVGEVFSEGAAGSVFSSVPVIIKPVDQGGGAKVFAGCYTVRAVNAQIQDPPFRPLTIEKGKLSAVGSDDADAMPDCGAGKPDPAATHLAQAIDLFRRSFAQQCEAAGPDREDLQPEHHTITFRYDYQSADEAPQSVRLYAFPCSTYAYNWSNVYLLQRNGEPPEVLSFAEPAIDTKFADEAQEEIQSMTLTGFTAQNVLINSEYDPQSQSIAFFAKGRGVGDMSSSGIYVFEEGTFVLKDYANDPTGNGEVDPVDLMKDGKVLEPKL